MAWGFSGKVPAPWLILTALALGEMVNAIEATMVYAALPTMAADVGDLILIGWIMTGNLLVQAATTAVAGSLGDRFGRRTVLIWVLVVSAIGSLLAVRGDIWWVIFGHGLQGVSGATMPLCLGLLRELMPREKVPFWVGVLMGSFAAAAAIGYILGGALAQYIHWRWLFAAGAIFALLGLAAIMLVIPKARPTGLAKRLDVIGGILFMPAVAGLLVTLTMGGRWGWTSLTTLGIAGFSLVTFLYWIWHELRSTDPLIDIRLFRQRGIACANFAYVVYGMGTVQLSFLFMLLLQQPVWTGIGFGVGATMAGVLKMPSNVAAIISAPFNGHIAGRRGTRYAMILAFLVSVLGWCMVCMAPNVLAIVVAASVAIGFSNAAVLAAVSNVIIESVPENRVSEVLGTSGVVRQVANAAGTLLLSGLLQMNHVVAQDGSGRQFPGLKAFALCFLVVAAFSLIGVFIGLTLPRWRQSSGRSAG